MLIENEVMVPVARKTPTMDLKSTIQNLCANYSTEVTLGAAASVSSFADLLPSGTDVYITSLPGNDERDIIALAKRLRNDGFNPVPHIAARSIANKTALQNFIERATGEAGVNSALVIAGALERPCGEFADSTHLLRTGLLEANGIHSIGVAGHPENCACCSEAELWAALAWKREYSQRVGLEARIVTQFAFEAAPFIDYDKALADKGFDLPLHIGVPGIANLKTLIRFAMICGVGNSINFLKRQARNVSRLIKPSAPDKLILDLARHLVEQPQTSIETLHMFPLGGIEKTVLWTNAVRDGRFEIKDDLSGLSVDTSYP